MNKKQLYFISDYISSNWNVSRIITAWNDYIEDKNPDSIVFDMAEFNYIYQDRTPLDIVNEVLRTGFCPNDDYFCYDNYGRIVSFNRLDDDDCPIDCDAIASFLMENGNSKYSDIDEDDAFDAFYEAFGLIYDKDEFRRVTYSLMALEHYDLITDDWDGFGGRVLDTFKNINKIDKAIKDSNDSCIKINCVEYIPSNETCDCEMCSITRKDNGEYSIGYFKNDVFFTEEISYLIDLSAEVIDDIVFSIE